MGEWDDRIDAPKDAHLARDFGTCFIRINNDAARKYVSHARTLAGMVANRMALAGVDSHAQRVTLDDGTVITAQIGIGHTVLTIDALPVEEGGARQVYWWDFCFIPRDKDNLYGVGFDQPFHLGIDPLRLIGTTGSEKYFWRYHYPHATEGYIVKALKFNPLHGNQFFVPVEDRLYSWIHSSNGDLPMLRLSPEMFEFTKDLLAFPVDIDTRQSVVVNDAEKLPCYTPLVAQIRFYRNNAVYDPRNLLLFGYFIEGPTHYQFIEFYDGSQDVSQDSPIVYLNNSIVYRLTDFFDTSLLSVKWIAGYGRGKLGDFCLFAIDEERVLGPVLYYAIVRWTDSSSIPQIYTINLGQLIYQAYPKAAYILNRTNWPCRISPNCTEGAWLIDACEDIVFGTIVNPVVALCRFSIDLSTGEVTILEVVPQQYAQIESKTSTQSAPVTVPDPGNTGVEVNLGYSNDRYTVDCTTAPLTVYDRLDKFVFTIDTETGTVTTKNYVDSVTQSGQPIIAVAYDADNKLLTATRKVAYSYLNTIVNRYRDVTNYDHRYREHEVSTGGPWNPITPTSSYQQTLSTYNKRIGDCVGKETFYQEAIGNNYHYTGMRKIDDIEFALNIIQKDELVSNNGLSLVLIDLTSTETHQSNKYWHDLFYQVEQTAHRITDQKAELYSYGVGYIEQVEDITYNIEERDGSWLTGNNTFSKNDTKLERKLLYLNLRNKTVVYTETDHTYSRTLEGSFDNANPSYARYVGIKDYHTYYLNVFGSPEINGPNRDIETTTNTTVTGSVASYNWTVNYAATQKAIILDYRKQDLRTLKEQEVYKYSTMVSTDTYYDIHDLVPAPFSYYNESSHNMPVEWMIESLNYQSSRSMVENVFDVASITPYLYSERTKAAFWMYQDQPVWYANLFNIEFPVQYYELTAVETNTPDNKALLAGLPVKEDEISLIPVGLVRLTDPADALPGSTIVSLFPISIVGENLP